jgi:serine/threonine protein phosphatase PrpC
VYVRERIASGVQPEEICESLMMKCLTPKGSCTSKGCDNMTVVIVGLLQGGTYEELSSKCARTYITESIDEEDISETDDESFPKQKMKRTFPNQKMNRSTPPVSYVQIIILNECTFIV